MNAKKRATLPENENFENDTEEFINRENSENDDNQLNPMEQAGFTECVEKKQFVYTSYSDAIKDFIEEVEAPSHEFEVYIYRLNPGRGNVGKKQINKLVNEIPDPHQIGLEYGSGRYQIYVSGIYDKNGKRRSFTKEHQLDTCYDDYKKEYDLKKQRSLTTIGNDNIVNGGLDQINFSMAIMERMLQLFQPIIDSKNNAPSNNLGLDMFAGIYKNMGKVMAQNMIDTQAMMNDQLRLNNNLAPVVETEEESTGVIAALERIMPMLTNIIPILLQPKPISKPLVKQIRQNPEYQKIINDNKKLTAAIKRLEKDHGAEKVNTILDRLEVKRPVEVKNNYEFVKPVIGNSV